MTFLWDCVLLLSLPSFCLTFRPSCSWPKAFAFNSHLFGMPAPPPIYWTLSPFLHFFPQMPPFLATLCNFISPTHTLTPYYIFLLSTYQPSYILWILFNLTVYPSLSNMKLHKGRLFSQLRKMFLSSPSRNCLACSRHPMLLPTVS